jgi:hypothetical protein
MKTSLRVHDPLRGIVQDEEPRMRIIREALRDLLRDDENRAFQVRRDPGLICDWRRFRQYSSLLARTF